MLFNSVACAFLATTFVFVQASPVKPELALKDGKKDTRVISKLVTKANKSVPPPYPNIEPDATHEHVDKKWQQDEEFLHAKLSERINALDILSKQPNKVQGIDKSHGYLESAHDIVKGWKGFYETEQGKKHDSSGSRLMEASQRANHIKNVKDATDYYHKETKEKWEKQRGTLQEKVAMVKAQYKSDDSAKIDLHKD